MTAPLSVEVPFPVFQDRDGQPLENGYIFLGVPNLNPQTNPVIAYFDEALTIVAPQPLRTINGYISNAGTPAQVYIDGVSFSILVQDSKGSMVYNFPDGTGISPDACGVTYNPPFVGGVAIPVCEKLAQIVSVKDFGAVGNGVADDSAAFASARAVTNRYYIPTGNYVLDASPDPFLDCYTSDAGVTLIIGGTSFNCSNAFAGPLRYVAASATKTNIVHSKTDNIIQYWQDGSPGTATGFFRGLAFTTDSHFIQCQPATNGGSTDLLFQRSTLNADPGGNRYNITFEENTDRLIYSYATTASGFPSFDTYLRVAAGTSPTLEFPALRPRFSQGWNVTTRTNGNFQFVAQPTADRVHFQDVAGVIRHMTFKDDGAVGFFGAGGVTRPTITGSRGGNAALASLLTALSQLGLVTDNTTA